MRPLRGLVAPLVAAVAGGALVFLVQATAQTRLGIESAPLTQLDGWSVGALTRQQGALAPTLWRQSDPQMLATLFDRTPATFESPAALALARQALLSPGQAPAGDGVAEAMRKRFSALGRMGAADDLAMMAAGAGPAASDPAVAQYAAQAELARGRRPEACLRGRNAAGDEASTFLLRLRAYCAAAQGERAAADLALELARAAGGEDSWFRAALAGVGEGAPRPAVTARYDNSLNASVSLAANLRAGANPLANASTLALGALARNSAAPPLLKAQAAAIAYRRGALTPAQARDIFTALPADTPATGLPAIVTALRTATAQPGGPEAGAAIASALRQAAAPADFAAAANLLRADIAALQNAPDITATLLFARAALVSGDTALASRILQSAAQGGAPAVSLAPLELALAIQRGNADVTAIHRRIDAAGPTGARAAARDVAIFAALGQPLDANARAYLIANAPSGGQRVDAGLLLALGSAADNEAAGEAALLGAIATAPGPGTLEIGSLASVLRSLRAAGLGEAARRIAVEAVLAGAPA